MTKQTTKPENPFNPANEGCYLAWDHGANSASPDDCPYEADDSENRPFRDAWLKGFRTSPHFKTNKEEKETIRVDQKETAPRSTTIDETNPLNLISTELLERELKKRKLEELKDLMDKEQSYALQLQQVQKQIQKLSILLGD